MIPLRTPAEALQPTAIALGSFDGLHEGHRAVIAAVAAAVRDNPALVPTVVSFWPHPREVLHGERRLRLDLPSEKLDLLGPLGIAQLVLVPFDRTLAALSPDAFVEQVLVAQLGARFIAVGENFRFGVGRSGSAHDLQTLAAARGVAVAVVPMLHDSSGRHSSSRIRAALAAGDLSQAAALLQRPYRFQGQVVRGRGLGKGLGWPTANLQVEGRKFLPREGVYAARTWLAGHSEPMAAVMNLGPQPTIDPASPSAVEVHLLDRRLELLGEELIVEPLRFLRDQQRFDGLEALKAQIARDADRARALSGGVGVGQAPADQGGDAAKQQNP
ncbi:MAG: bifunctional riboflavin kinase/FAD synthetase [Cyanobacteria bacterium K_Offshore_0m_m2_072]|nr:bifunctional riboflavin kinase/FAD synthetase [Cyanobacteria bacterium K_Offshore_0m_m2_072]